MGLPSGHYAYYRVGGSVATDTWSTGFWMNAPNGVAAPTQANMDNDLAFVLGQFNSSVWAPASNPVKGVNPSGVNLSTASSIYYIDGVAKASSKATITAVPGTGSSGSYVPSAALVCTLLSGVAGRRYRGRMYLPACAPNSTASTLQWAVAPPYAATMKAFFDAVEAHTFELSGDSTQRVSIVSRAATGHIQQVNVLRMDSIIDSQRGRKDKFIATTISTSTLAGR